MKKSKQIKVLKAKVAEHKRLRDAESQRGEALISELDDAIRQWRDDYIMLEQAVRGVRANGPNPGVSDFGRGWSQCMSEVEAAILAVQSFKPVRVIDKMELVGVSLDLHGDPHSEIRVVESHAEGTVGIITNGSLGEALMGGRVDNDTDHFIHLDDHGWTIQHPLSCRPHLFNCPVTQAAQDLTGEETDEVGTWPCAITEEGGLVIDWGAPITPVVEGPWKSSATYPNEARKIKDNPQA